MVGATLVDGAIDVETGTVVLGVTVTEGASVVAGADVVAGVSPIVVGGGAVSVDPPPHADATRLVTAIKTGTTVRKTDLITAAPPSDISPTCRS
ncbi:MAG TPA: hypothetical protein DGK99_05945, partial [Acidimicrobiaceae bacterium]|nr:hypothetical protein [Acidimicrobiaceae bacterium]